MGVVESIIQIIEGLHGLYSLREVTRAIRSDPRDATAIAILLLAGALAAIIIRRIRRHDFPSIR